MHMIFYMQMKNPNKNNNNIIQGWPKKIAPKLKLTKKNWPKKLAKIEKNGQNFHKIAKLQVFK